MPTVLITGANRGIGREFVSQFETAGWRVISTCRDPASAGLPGEVHALDVTDGAAVAALAKELSGTPIDMLLNNAGISAPRERSTVGHLDYDAWEDVLRVNALGPMRVAEAFVDHVAASDRKTMIFITSMMGSIAQNGGGAYIYRSSKTCLNMAVNCLSKDLKPRGISCVLFHPGWVRTDMGGPAAALDTKTSVSSMMNVFNRLSVDDTGRFLNYDGFDFPW